MSSHVTAISLPFVCQNSATALDQGQELPCDRKSVVTQSLGDCYGVLDFLGRRVYVPANAIEQKQVRKELLVKSCLMVAMVAVMFAVVGCCCPKCGKSAPAKCAAPATAAKVAAPAPAKVAAPVAPATPMVPAAPAK